MSIGFENAPVTQLLLMVVLLGSFMFGSSELVALDIFRISNGQFWRLITGQLIFENMGQTVVGAMLLYTFRQFERQMGSKKFGCFVVMSLLMSIMCLLTIAILAMSIEAVFIPASGPFALIFASLALFYARIPKLHGTEYQFMGISFSEKSWIYLLAGQLLFSTGLRSLLPALTGYAVGYAYDRNYFSLQIYRLPRLIETSFATAGTFISSFIPAPTRPTRQAPIPGGGGGGQNQQQAPRGLGAMGGGFMGGGGGMQPPSEEAITTLMGMGFDRPAVMRALEMTGNNLEAAANILLR